MLEFSSEPVTDTVWFVFTVPDISTPDNNIDTTKTNNPAEALFKVTPNGNNFEFTAKDGITPEDFTALYGNMVSHEHPRSRCTPTTGNQDSLPLSFTITAYHDASPQFHHSATYQSKQRWDTDTVIEVYEGPQNVTDALQIPWTSTTEGARTWTLGRRHGGQPRRHGGQPEYQVQGPKRDHHPHLGRGRQRGQRAVLNRPTAGRPAARHIPLRFASPPDYEDAPGPRHGQRISGTAGQPPRHPRLRRRIPNSGLRRLGAGPENKSQGRGATGPADRADPKP